MEPNQHQKRYYGPFFLLCRWIWRSTHRRQPMVGLENIVGEPAVFIGRHQDMYGPVEIMAWSPVKLRIWALSCFTDRRECYRQFSEYTFHTRKGWPLPLARLVAGIISPPVALLMHSMRAIPVYRGRREIMETFRGSLKALTEGENLLVMPERDYTDEGDDAGEMYSGFVQLARLYHRATGKALHFYPIYPAREDAVLYVEKPVVFNPEADYRAERDRVLAELRRRLSLSTVRQDFDQSQPGGYQA